MEKECCNIKVTEMEKGFRIEVTGDDLKEKCKTVMEGCCSSNAPWAELMKFFKSACH